MRIIILLIFTSISVLFAFDKVTDNKVVEKKKLRVEKQIKKEMEREKEYAIKQTFYIDLKGAEINEESIKDVPELEVDDFDMDSVYD